MQGGLAVLLHRDRALALMEEAGVDALLAGSATNVVYLTGYMSDVLLSPFYECQSTAALARRPGAEPDLVSEPDILPLLRAGHDGPVDPSRGLASVCERCADRLRCWGEPVLVLGERDLVTVADRPVPVRHLRTYDRLGFTSLLETATGVAQTPAAERNPLQSAIAALRAYTQGTFSRSLVEATAAMLRDMGLDEAVIATDNLRLASHLAPVLPRARFVDGYDLFRRIRLVKTEDEIALMRESMRINEIGVRAAMAATRAGVLWSDVLEEHRAAVARAGGKWCGQWGILFGPRHMSAFALENKGYRLRPGDAVVFDSLVQYRQYWSDMARTGVIGPATERQRALYRAVRAAAEAVEAHALPGVHSSRLVEVAREALEREGAPASLCLLLPHGIGQEIFEFPGSYGREHEGFTLEENMTINFEVLQHAPEDGGAFHLEETLVVRRSGAESLATMPREMLETA